MQNDEHIVLSVYDVSGRLVRTLVNHGMASGEHSVIWDGRNNNDLPVSAGTYFVKMIADGITVGKGRVVLVR